jgi:hypothetical protein
MHHTRIAVASLLVTLVGVIAGAVVRSTTRKGTITLQFIAIHVHLITVIVEEALDLIT